jgi:hypothetical protein
MPHRLINTYLTTDLNVEKKIKKKSLSNFEHSQQRLSIRTQEYYKSDRVNNTFILPNIPQDEVLFLTFINQNYNPIELRVGL